MSRWKIIAIVILASLAFFIIGDRKNEVLEIQNNGATMCLACVGLE